MMQPAHDSVLVIIGSSRGDSDTRKFVELTFADSTHTVLDLHNYHLDEYDYEANYSSADQFEEVMRAILSHHVIVFATPVYWYAMSARLKILFDRFTDCITISKEQGRKLRGKKVAMLAVGNDRELPEGFAVPFSRTAKYLGMKYLGEIYFSSALPVDSDAIAALEKFRKTIVQAVRNE